MDRPTYTLTGVGTGWCAIIEHLPDGSERQVDVLPEPVARARVEELTGEPWAGDSEQAGADRPS